MDRRDIVIGLVIVLLVVGVVYFRRDTDSDQDTTVPQTLSVEDTIEERFNLEIPEDIDKAELKNVSDGDSSALATRKIEDGVFVHTILADLPDLEAGKVYSAELQKGSELVSTGNLRLAKGGYILEYEGSESLNEYNKVRVKLGDDVILEGDF